MKMLGSIFAVAVAVREAHAGGTWGYAHQGEWDGACKGTKNSPIDIDTTNAKPAAGPDALNALDFIQKHVEDKMFTTQMSKIEGSHALKFTLVPEPEYKDIKCAQFHFHFDKSEHTFDGQHRFGEVHMVCYKSRNADLNAAVAENKKDSLAVFGFWLDVADADGAEDHPEVTTILENVSQNSNGGVEAHLKFPLPSTYGQLYRYWGGLTTPTCNEVVQWTVFKDPIMISGAQADAIRKWPSALHKNNREVQALNGREIEVYNIPADTKTDDVPTPAPGTEHEGMSTTMIIVIVVAFLVVLGGVVFFLKRKESGSGKAPEVESAPLKH